MVRPLEGAWRVGTARWRRLPDVLVVGEVIPQATGVGQPGGQGSGLRALARAP